MGWTQSPAPNADRLYNYLQGRSHNCILTVMKKGNNKEQTYLRDNTFSGSPHI